MIRGKTTVAQNRYNTIAPKISLSLSLASSCHVSSKAFKTIESGCVRSRPLYSAKKTASMPANITPKQSIVKKSKAIQNKILTPFSSKYFLMNFFIALPSNL